MSGDLFWTLEAALERQESGWANGTPVGIDELLEQFPQLIEQEESILQLIYSDHVMHCDLGVPSRARQHLEKFPALVDRFERLLALGEAMDDVFDEPEHSSGSSTETEPLKGSTVVGATSDDTLTHTGPEHGTFRDGRYQLIREVGAGLFSRTFYAYDSLLASELRLKVIRVPETDASTVGISFLGRTRQVAAIDCPGLPKNITLGRNDVRTCFVAQPWLDGETLATRLVSDTPGAAQFIGWLQLIAETIGFVHDAGLTHGRLTPSNIVVEKNGGLQLVDFSPNLTAEQHRRLIRCSRRRPFLSPERQRSLIPTQTAEDDLFAFGVIIQRCLDAMPAAEASEPNSLRLELLVMSRRLTGPCEQRPNASEVSAILRTL